MAIFEEVGEIVFESSPVGRVLVGVGVLAIAPVAIPALRPVTKQAVKGVMGASRRVRRSVAETGERWSDLVAEARAELDATAPDTGSEIEVSAEG
jgi:hypothetical protein